MLISAETHRHAEEMAKLIKMSSCLDLLSLGVRDVQSFLMESQGPRRNLKMLLNLFFRSKTA